MGVLQVHDPDMKSAQRGKRLNEGMIGCVQKMKEGGSLCE